MESEKQIIVVLDIAAGMSREDAERLLNAPYAEGYNLVSTFPENAGIRAVYRLSAEARKTGTQKEDEERAIAFLKANTRLTSREAYIQLRGRGITRSQTWVDLKRAELGLPRGRGVR